MTARHNFRLCGPRLPLSEVGAGGRLTHTVAAYRALVPERRWGPYPAELIAARIRRDGLWAAVVDYGISYSHACRIRRGWRPGGRQVELARVAA